jgi:hypothetical protein
MVYVINACSEDHKKVNMKYEWSRAFWSDQIGGKLVKQVKYKDKLQ